MTYCWQLTIVALTVFIPNPAWTRTSDTLRVATYNILWMNSKNLAVGDRAAKLKQVIQKLDADVIGLQEVANRTAAETVFTPDQWNVIIDDDSTDEQQTAFAVRKGLLLGNVASDLDADEQNFLAAEDAVESYFPNDRDALTIEVTDPVLSRGINLVSVHLKSRVGGRQETNERRVGAARILVDKFKAKWPDNTNIVLLGDFNDNPDDQSLNILESGNSETAAGVSMTTGTFLVNLSEPLVAQGAISHGASEHRLDPSNPHLLNIKHPESRERNNKGRNRLAGSGPILFDQILVSPALLPHISGSSAHVFREKAAVQGPGAARPSDHLPVYADIKW